MKVLFWVPYPTEGASNRYRVEQYLPYLKKEGIKYSLHPFWSGSVYKILYKKGYFLRKAYFFIWGTICRLLDLIGIIKYDMIFIHREAYPIGGAFFETALSIFKKPFVFDFDDAIFLPASSHSNNLIERFKKPDKVTTTIRKSKYVIAGNSYLADFALQYNSRVRIIPTPIDTLRYYPNDKKHNEEVTIGWMGSITTADFLNTVANVFIRLSERFPRIKFKIVGSNFSIKGLSNIVSKPWSLEEEMEDLSTFDIGIMPMPDNAWTNGECGFKAILYMSMGIACVCSPVGVNKEIIKEGANGFLADTDDEWTSKLSLLIEDSELRYRIAIAGRKTIEDKYSVKMNAPKFLEIIYSTSRKSQV